MVEARKGTLGIRFVQRVKENDLDLLKGKRQSLDESSTECTLREGVEELQVDLRSCLKTQDGRTTVYVQNRFNDDCAIMAISGVLLSPTALQEDHEAPADLEAAALESTGTHWVSLADLHREIECKQPLGMCSAQRGVRPVYGYAAMIVRLVARLLTPSSAETPLTLQQFSQALYDFARLGTKPQALCRSMPADPFCFGRQCLACRRRR